MKEAYKQLKKDSDLPDFDVLNKEFEIITIEPEGFLLREIKRRINEKLSSACDLLTALIQPESTSLVDLYECRCFDEAEKNKIFALFSNVMYLKRKINESELLLDDNTYRLILYSKFSYNFVDKAKQAKLDQDFGTVILNKLSDLEPFLFKNA